MSDTASSLEGPAYLKKNRELAVSKRHLLNLWHEYEQQAMNIEDEDIEDTFEARLRDFILWLMYSDDNPTYEAGDIRTYIREALNG